MLVVLEKQFQVLKSNRCLRFELACNQVLVSLLFSVGLSNGSVAIASIGESQLETQETWKAHDFEVWTASYDIHQPQLVYSGSDDCKFKCWDLRDGPSKLAFQNTKGHAIVVCCIAKNFHPFVAGLVLTACMHNGFSIVYINEDKTEVIETYSKHESLAFGADWHRDKSFHEGKRNSTLVATCSFYDRLLRLWMLESDLQDSTQWLTFGLLSPAVHL
ncbi:hypothetical protein DVH24_008710 [Malus domestica]|uniref:methylated diphthine methylhydrolase n=1 Tax=Malus domestica TaxID=3750 RepID=A0A498JMC8_MALDO|nr:hypothetical protein DVH24_008710 [Malus domestica]